MNNTNKIIQDITQTEDKVSIAALICIFHDYYYSCMDKAKAAMGQENFQKEYAFQIKMNKLYKDLGLEEEMGAGYNS